MVTMYIVYGGKTLKKKRNRSQGIKTFGSTTNLMENAKLAKKS